MKPIVFSLPRSRVCPGAEEALLGLTSSWTWRVGSKGEVQSLQAGPRGCSPESWEWLSWEEMGEAEDRWRDEEGEGQLGWEEGHRVGESTGDVLTLSSASSLGSSCPPLHSPVRREETSDWRRKTQQSCSIRLMKAVIHPSVPSCPREFHRHPLCPWHCW